MQNEVKFIRGNIFTSSAQTLVNTVNTVGVMGAGIALEFRYRYPDMYQKYVSYCRSGMIEIGKLWIYDVPNSNQKILNFPTKKDWKHPSKYEYLEKGLIRFSETYKQKNITSIAFPLLGAQNGGLDPERVKQMMRIFLSKCDIPVEVYEYASDAADDLFPVFYEELVYTPRELEKAGIKKNTVQRLRQLIDQYEIKSLAKLVKQKGVGEETAKAIYSFSMTHKRKRKPIPQEIFTSASNDPENVSELNGPAEELQKSSITAAITNVTENKSSIKPRSKKKSKNLTLEQKMLLTGLSENLIVKIEEANKDVTIQNILAYCEGMKINPKTFITKQYFDKAK